MPLITCIERCDLPDRTEVKVTPKQGAFNAWKGIQEGELEEFSAIVAERALIKTSEMLDCKIGVEKIKPRKTGVNMNVAHDCRVDPEDFEKAFSGMVDVVEDEVSESKRKIDVQFDGEHAPYIQADYEGVMAPVLKEIGSCSVFTPSWSSPDGNPRRTFIPTRQCLDKVQSALSSVHSVLGKEPDMWDFAKEKGEKVTITEDIIGSYLFYHLRGEHPLSMEACQDLYDEKVIDGVNVSYSTPKTKSPDIPVDIKKMLEELYPEKGGRSFAQRIERYIEDDRLHMSRKAGQCEILTSHLKDAGEISKSWVWFGDGKDVIVFNPDKATEILTEWGYDVSLETWKQDISRSPLVKVEGLNCSLRDYQVDPICRWTKQVASVVGENKNESKYDWKMEKRKWVEVIRDPYTDKVIKEIEHEDEFKRLLSYDPPVATGGIIKAPTGAGKTIIGLVLMATQGAGVPDAMEVGD